MYISILFWRDEEDGHMYFPFSKYPFDGREVKQERIDELLGKDGRKPVIIEIKNTNE